MKKQELLGVAIKVLGLYLLVMTVQTLPSISFTLSDLRSMEVAEAIWYVAVNVISILLMGAVALSFIIYTPEIIKWVSDKEPGTKNDVAENDTVISKAALQEVVFSGLGIYFVVISLPRLIGGLLTLPKGSASVPYIGAIIQFGAGIYLFFKPKQLVGLAKKFQDKKIE